MRNLLRDGDFSREDLQSLAVSGTGNGALFAVDWNRVMRLLSKPDEVVIPLTSDAFLHDLTLADELGAARSIAVLTDAGAPTHMEKLSQASKGQHCAHYACLPAPHLPCLAAGRGWQTHAMAVLQAENGTTHVLFHNDYHSPHRPENGEEIHLPTWARALEDDSSLFITTLASSPLVERAQEAMSLIWDASTSTGMGCASGSELLGKEWPTVLLHPDNPVSNLPPLCKRLPLIHSPSCHLPPQIDRLPALCHVAAAERGGGLGHPESGTGHGRERFGRIQIASRAWRAPPGLYCTACFR